MLQFFAFYKSEVPLIYLRNIIISNISELGILEFQKDTKKNMQSMYVLLAANSLSLRKHSNRKDCATMLHFLAYINLVQGTVFASVL